LAAYAAKGRFFMADWYQNSRDGQLHMVKTWNTVFAISGQRWQVLLINRKNFPYRTPDIKEASILRKDTGKFLNG
jgi:hypothetical protein